LLYKLTGIWGYHEGSMLLWVFILSVCSAAMAVFRDNLPPELRARVGGAGYDRQRVPAVHPLTSNPFQRVPIRPTNGDGLKPVVQDRGLAFHPPFLYLGNVGFSVSFCFAFTALIEGRVDAAWARWVRPWALAS
jgi:cytochrome c-type biogenesis protein CcmF